MTDQQVQDLPYDLIGGALGVRRLVTRFYELMDQLPEAEAIRKMHPDRLDSSREKLYEFLSGWLGGPQLFMERRGHPRLRMRHMPFAIDTAASDAWLACMRRALAECVEDETLRQMLQGAFERMAYHLRNQNEQRRPEDELL